MILRWPEYYPRSRKLHFIFIVIIWIFSNAPWTAPFINDRVFVLYPRGVCGFSIQKNRYFVSILSPVSQINQARQDLLILQQFLSK